MRVSRIYHPFPMDCDAVIELSDNAANHVARVLRLTPGSPVILFNGTGGQFMGAIETIGKRTVTVRLATFDPHESESPLHITLAQGISRGERMDYTIQKAVELGVNQIIPLITEHCNVRLDHERAAKRQQHWQAVAISACEQSGRNYVPACLPPVNLNAWLADQINNEDILRVVLHHRADKGLRAVVDRPRTITLLAGPEGGLSDAEIQSAMHYGFNDAKLGPRVLRTETAALAALASLQTLWGDF